MTPAKVGVLLLITELDRGGAERVVADLAMSIDRTLFNVTVGTLWPGGDLAQEIAAHGTPVDSIGSKRTKDPRLVWSFMRVLAKRRIDIVHSHLPLAGLVARLAVRAHPTIADVYTEHNVPSTYDPAARALNCVSLRLPQEVVSVSAEVRRSWARLRCGRSRASPIVRNGIYVPSQARSEDVRRRVRALIGIPPQSPVVITVANLFARKGIGVLLNAFAGIQLDPQPRLVIVGDGPLRAQLESTSSDLGIRERTSFLGTRGDVSDLLQAADVFALPSINEGLPIALLEAMAQGIPSVATRVGGIPEVIVSGENGLLVPVGDVVGLRARLSEVLSSPTLRHRLGDAGRERILEQFDVSVMTRAYQAIYRDALRRRRSNDRHTSP
jgi:glycosyltransferase involved in cell wall biosynthesis